MIRSIIFILPTFSIFTGLETLSIRNNNLTLKKGDFQANKKNSYFTKAHKVR